MATPPPKVSRYTSIIHSDSEIKLDTITKKKDVKSRNLAECGISLLFPCVSGNYGCNGEYSKKGSSRIDQDDNTYSNYTNYTSDTNDTNDKDEKLLRRVASWMSSFSEHENEYYWNTNTGYYFHKAKSNNHKEEENMVSNDEIARTHVKFEYPPISSFKRISRYTKEETKKLFFSERELSQINRDRMSSSSMNEIETVMSKPPSSPSCDKSKSTMLKLTTRPSPLSSPKSVAAEVNDVTVMMAET